MKGLFYKDMICSRVPQLFLRLLLALVLPAGVLYFIIPESKEFIVFFYSCMYVLTVYFMVLGFFVENIASTDSGVRIEAYMQSLPVGKKKSIAVKYLVVFSVFATLMLLFMLLYFIDGYLFQNEPGVVEAGKEIISWLPAISSVCLIIAAIEMPFYFRFGVQAGNNVRIALLVILFYAWLVYMLFGDLTVFDKFTSENIFAFLNGHPKFLDRLKWMSGAVMLVVYTLSWMLSSRLYSKKEMGE